MLKQIWNALVAVSTILGVVTGAQTILGNAAAERWLLYILIFLVVLLLLRLFAPKFTGFYWKNHIKVSLLPVNTASSSDFQSTYIPLRRGVAHQIWHGSSVVGMQVTVDGGKVQVTKGLHLPTEWQVSFGRQLRIFRPYKINRTVTYALDAFNSSDEFYYFQVSTPTGLLILELDFGGAQRLPKVVTKQIRQNADMIDQGTLVLRNNAVVWKIRNPRVGDQYWFTWSW